MLRYLNKGEIYGINGIKQKKKLYFFTKFGDEVKFNNEPFNTPEQIKMGLSVWVTLNT
jgi:hypothetical protein